VARSYADRDLKLLFGLSAARCAFPQCRQLCIVEQTAHDPAAMVGQIAHIIAHSNQGPRSDPMLSEKERDRYDNLILLCATHHLQVDGQANTYAIQQLRQWKADHEQWVQSALAQEMPRVTFRELEMVTSAIIALAMPVTTNFSITPPQEKMQRNRLTDKSSFRLTIGLSKAKEVGDFVKYIAALKSDFPEQLTAGFLNEYQKLLGSGLVGDALFQALTDFASGGSRAFDRQAAGIAVVAYLFEKCELFEK
jgi:hypothetical protein